MRASLRASCSVVSRSRLSADFGPGVGSGGIGDWALGMRVLEGDERVPRWAIIDHDYALNGGHPLFTGISGLS